MDTDPNSEVSALLDALDDSTELEVTANEGSEAQGQEDEQNTSAAQEQQTEEASDDENAVDQEEQASTVIEFDGKQWELPPGTPPEVAAGVKKMADDLKADYTRKRQAAAEEEKQVKQHAQNLSELRQIMAATEEARSQRNLVQWQISQIESEDWATLANQDPARAAGLQQQHQKLTRALQQLDGHMQQLTQAEQQRMAQGRQLAESEVEKAVADLIPGFNERINQQLLEAAMHCGFTAEEAATAARTSLPVLKLINLARIGLEFQKAKPAALKKVAEAPRVVKPQAPPARRENQSAFDRLKKTGRAEELVNFL